MSLGNLINIEKLHELCGGEDLFTVEIIDLFLAQTPGMVTDIKNAYLSHDAELLKKKAHKLKSSACLLGISRLTDLLLLIENKGLGEISENEMKDILKEINEIVDLACKQLKEERKKYPA